MLTRRGIQVTNEEPPPTQINRNKHTCGLGIPQRVPAMDWKEKKRTDSCVFIKIPISCVPLTLTFLIIASRLDMSFNTL